MTVRPTPVIPCDVCTTPFEAENQQLWELVGCAEAAFDGDEDNARPGRARVSRPACRSRVCRSERHTMTVAALYVETGGIYYGLPDVDPWDEARDARLYAGPWPVVAHPPCARWSNLAHIHKHRWPIGSDAGCFAAALEAVQTWGGVLEHPAGSLAWSHFGLPHPARDGWSAAFADPGFATEVDQSNYGHRGLKRTWLYAVGVEPAELDWRIGRTTYPVENMSTAGGEAARTPEAFRDVLLSMAATAQRVAA